jgi:hypothetical protein
MATDQVLAKAEPASPGCGETDGPLKSDEASVFLRDPKVLELIAASASVDDIFETIWYTENQRAELLSWCLNPNAGHRRGDEMIKDFLESASLASAGATADSGQTFKNWTPRKIQGTSFRAAFVTREIVVEADIESCPYHVDVFLVDPRNRLLCAVVISYGMFFARDASDRLADATKDKLTALGCFDGYDLAFVLLDRHLQQYSDDDLAAAGKRWTVIDYGWLEKAAKRVDTAKDRDHADSQMIIAYCQKHTTWAGSEKRRRVELATDVIQSYPLVMDAIRSVCWRVVPEWRYKTLAGVEGRLAQFCASHVDVCRQLIRMEGIARMVAALLAADPTLTMSRDIRIGSTWLCAKPARVGEPSRGDDGWPAYIKIDRDITVSRDQARYVLCLVWVSEHFDRDICDEAALRLALPDEFPDLAKPSTTEMWRVVIARGLGPDEATRRAVQLIGRLAAAFQTSPGWDRRSTGVRGSDEGDDERLHPDRCSGKAD